MDFISQNPFSPLGEKLCFCNPFSHLPLNSFPTFIPHPPFSGSARRATPSLTTPCWNVSRLRRSKPQTVRLASAAAATSSASLCERTAKASRRRSSWPQNPGESSERENNQKLTDPKTAFRSLAETTYFHFLALPGRQTCLFPRAGIKGYSHGEPKTFPYFENEREALTDLREVQPGFANGEEATKRSQSSLGS